MKFTTDDRFDRDFRKLPADHQQKFRSLMPAFNTACEAYVADPGTSWPAALRVKPMLGAKGIWEMTWSFAGPDGRATFDFIAVDDQVQVRWRRIGRHEIFDAP